MPFLSPNQQCQSTEGKTTMTGYDSIMHNSTLDNGADALTVLRRAYQLFSTLLHLGLDLFICLHSLTQSVSRPAVYMRHKPTYSLVVDDSARQPFFATRLQVS